VDARISKAQGVVRQVSELMVHDPQGTYARIAASDQLTHEDLTTLRELMTLSEPSLSRGDRRTEADPRCFLLLMTSSEGV
ncbi:MAG: hypothetical protein ACREJ8_03430, partial [Candidatus Methylomirabilales bacterium]